MAYRIYLGDSPSKPPTPCTFVKSVIPGKLISVNEDGRALVVLPDGTERVPAEPPGPNFDSPWTQGEALGEMLVYRSEQSGIPGVPRAYRMLDK